MELVAKTAGFHAYVRPMQTKTPREWIDALPRSGVEDAVTDDLERPMAGDGQPGI